MKSKALSLLILAVLISSFPLMPGKGDDGNTDPVDGPDMVPSLERIGSLPEAVMQADEASAGWAGPASVATGGDLRMARDRPSNLESTPAGIEPTLLYETKFTRGSDAEGEQHFYDLSNGSVLSGPSDTVSGSMYYDTAGTDSDWVDWYKFDLADIDPSPGAPGGVRNVTFDLDSYLDDSDGYGLYEFALTPLNETTYTLSDDYADFVELYLVYFDPTKGMSWLGGWMFLFDDGDDSDGWSHAANRTLDYVAPVPSTGPEDPDGGTNGITEVGWYYIGISMNWYEKTASPERSSFGIHYRFTLDTSRKEDTDQGANTMEEASDAVSGQVHRVFSRYNNVDWYRIEGSDPSKLWYMTFNVTRTGAVLPRPSGNMFFDPWLHVYLFYHNDGPDDVWDTADDGMSYLHLILSAFLEGTYQDAYIISGPSQYFDIYLKNTWTQTAKREAYIGIYSEPITFIDDGTGIDLNPPVTWFALSEYTIDIDIIEETPNRAPSIPNFDVGSDWADDPDGGHFGSEFTFTATYQDLDNDPPESIFLRIDPDTPDQVEYDILRYPVNPSDSTYTDGKTYRMTLTGEDIGEGVHDITIMANDSIVDPDSLRTSLFSPSYFINDTLEVWDDDPVMIDPLWEGEIVIEEDDAYSTYAVLSQGTYHGPFSDREGNLVSVKIRPTGTSDWTDSAAGGSVIVSVIKDLRYEIRIDTLLDRFGTDSFEVRALDDHSSAIASFSVEVSPMNDLPVITAIARGSGEDAVEMVAPGRFEADMSEDWTVPEDQELEFRIIATDVDSGTLSYAYLPDLSDDWEVDPVVDTNGVVTLEPRNSDIRNTDMTFSVSDGIASVQLLVVVEVTNVNDKPAIAFRTEPKDSYQQFERLEARVGGDDIDPGDVLTYDMNMEKDLGSEHPSILKQLNLPGMDPDDWRFDTATGEFWMQLDDQSIWGIGPDRNRERTIDLAFLVKDRAGQTSVVSKEVTVRDVNEAPEPPSSVQHEVRDSDTDPATEYSIERFSVRFWLFHGSDPDGDTLQYSWDFGDGSTGTGSAVNHTYGSAGRWTVVVTASDGELSSVDATVLVTTNVTIIPEPKDPDGPGSVLPIIIVAILVLVLLAGTGLFIFLRSRGRPVEEVGGTRPGSGRSEQMSSCPNCGANVNPTWFICPQCKAPLQ